MTWRVLERKLAITSAGALAALATWGAGTAVAVTGDGGSGSYGPGSGANTYNATVNNTGSTSHRYDYVQAPAGISVTACAPVSGFPAGTTCTPNEAGSGTAEVNIASPGLAAGQTGVFSFTTGSPIVCGARRTAISRGGGGCPTLRGAINSTGNPTDYVLIAYDGMGFGPAPMPPSPPQPVLPPPDFATFLIGGTAIGGAYPIGFGFFGNVAATNGSADPDDWSISTTLGVLEAKFKAYVEFHHSAHNRSLGLEQPAAGPVAASAKIVTVIVGTARATVPAHTKKKLPLKLSKKGLSLITFLKTASVRITVTVRHKTGANTVFRKTVKLRARKPKK